MTKRVRRSPQQWQAIIDRQAASNLSARAFCDTNQFSYPVFCKWRKRLVSSDQPALIDLTTLVHTSQATQWDIELELGDGMTLRMRRG